MKIRMISRSGIYPEYETQGAAGMDIRAWLPEPVTIEPGKRALIPTGLFMEIPPGFEVQLRARSGLAIRQGICLANGIGTIDSDYRGEVQVALINLGEEPFTVRSGDRIAQMVAASYVRAEIEPAEELTASGRGGGGFGSTGIE
ncbi:MAG: dUTP diphosphatase [Firmicutes bacterium]|nr:dUTP diphosphatase [Bacillota bacterium]